MENSKLHAPAAELALLSGQPLPSPSSDNEEEESKPIESEPPTKKKKVRGPKGPNPLSVPKKKKQNEKTGQLTAVQEGKKRAREEVDEGMKERKRKREENERVLVVSRAGRNTERAKIGVPVSGEGEAEGGGGEAGDKKKRKRRRKNKAGGEGGGSTEQGGGE